MFRLKNATGYPISQLSVSPTQLNFWGPNFLRPPVIKPGEVREAIVKIEKRGAADQAGRVLQRVKAVYRWAVIHERIASNPMLDLVLSEILKPREVQHRAAMADKELPEFLRKLDAYEGDPHTVHALRMVMLTATRPGEVRGARWAEFDLDAALWVIPPERMKMKTPHIVPLSPQAVEVLKVLHTLSGGRELLFPGERDHSKPMSNNTILKALERMGYKGRMTGHGFRGMASTILHEQGYAHHAIELQLAHQERNEVSAAYNHATYIQQRTKMMQHWADYLDSCTTGKVLAFERAAA